MKTLVSWVGGPYDGDQAEMEHPDDGAAVAVVQWGETVTDGCPDVVKCEGLAIYIFNRASQTLVYSHTDPEYEHRTQQVYRP